MKNFAVLCLLLCLTLLSGCTASPTTGDKNTFEAIIIELSDNSALVEPDEGTAERKSSDRISFSTNGLDNIGVSTGDRVSVTYTGAIMESYPAQIRVVSWELTRSGQDVATDVKSSNNNDNVSKEEDSDMFSLPVLMLENGERSFALPSDGGSWSYKNKFGQWISIYIDIMHPLDSNRVYHGIPYNSEYILSFNSDIKPDEISIICWKSSYITSDDIYSAPFERIELDGDKFIPREDVEYIYQLSVRWSDTGGAFHGTGLYLFTLTGKDKPYDTDGSADFKARYIFTDNSDGGDVPPPVSIVSCEELEKYYNENRGKFNFDSSSEGPNLKETIEKYDKTFFADKSLIIAIQKAPCSSFDYEVLGVYDDGRIILREISHPIDTAIVNYRHIIIEVNKNIPFLLNNKELKFVILRMEAVQ